MMKEKGFDNFGKTFNNICDFFTFLAEREKATTRLEVKANELNFVSVDHALRFYKTVPELAKRLGVAEELVKDTIECTNLIVVINKEPYLLGTSSWISIKNRMDIYGTGFDKLDAETKAHVMRKRFAQLGEDKVKVIIVENKIRAIMSDEYAVIPASEVFMSIVEEAENRFENYELREALADHLRTRLVISFPELQNEINELYQLPDKYTPGLIIETSDVGYSANKVGSYWLLPDGTGFINTNEYIYVPHIGKASLNKVLKELPNLFLKYQNTLKKFAQLITVEIPAPVTVLKKACKHIGIPKKYIARLVEQFELNYQNVPKVTAYDICREIFSVPAMVGENRRQEMEEVVGKAINLNYAKLMEDDDEE